MKSQIVTPKSPYLQHKMMEIISTTGFSIQELADKTGLSYGYMRRITNGSVVPNRDALKRICDGLGLDFAVEWRATHPLRTEPYEASIPKALADASGDLSGPGEEEAGHLAMRRRVNQIMDMLPIEGMLELLEEAWKLSDKYRNNAHS